MAEHHRAEHDFFGKLLGFRFDHQDGVFVPGDDEIELALRHLFERRVQHVFVVDEGDACAADRTHEGRAGKRKRRGNRDHRHDVGIVFEIVRKHGGDDLRVAAPAVGEQRADRPVDQTRGERFLFGRTAFALEISAGDAARGEEFFLVVDGERKKVESRASVPWPRRRSRSRWCRRRWREPRRRPGARAFRFRELGGVRPSRFPHDECRTCVIFHGLRRRKAMGKTARRSPARSRSALGKRVSGDPAMTLVLPLVMRRHAAAMRRAKPNCPRGSFDYRRMSRRSISF